jgi:hypothetical protein
LFGANSQFNRLPVAQSYLWLTYVIGRQTNDTRIVDGGKLDSRNAHFARQEALTIFENEEPTSEE